MLGPIDHFSSGWQSDMTVPTQAVTFLMVFLILRAQTKDTRAIQIKLNEIIAVSNGANNQLINIENLSEEEIDALCKRYELVASHVKKDQSVEGSTESLIPYEIAAESL